MIPDFCAWISDVLIVDLMQKLIDFSKESGLDEENLLQKQS